VTDPRMVTPHFAWSEFTCRSGHQVPAELRPNVLRLCEQLEVLRAHLGKSIRITSGYRDPDYNAAIGGAKRSRHMTGEAADIRVAGMGAGELLVVVEDLIHRGDLHVGGVGVYLPRDRRPLGWLHLDVRPGRARWRG